MRIFEENRRYMINMYDMDFDKKYKIVSDLRI